MIERWFDFSIELDVPTLEIIVEAAHFDVAKIGGHLINFTVGLEGFD